MSQAIQNGSAVRRGGMRRALATVAACLLLGACATARGPVENDPYYAPAYPEPPRADFDGPGGVQQARFGMSLFTDVRANRVGDVLTVVLTERTAASKSADTSTIKDTEISMNDATALGRGIGIEGYGLSADISQERDFTGEAESSQSNSLNGSIAVTVTDVMPNGLLVVRGEKWLQLNRGNEFIRVSGLVREADIGADNTVASTKLADARIRYSGTGELADSNRPGWASRFFNGPWWPF
jgi:flagellar L-ring protein precursor FlgH